MKKALIFGASGQAGSYLAEFLLTKPDYEVVGTYCQHATNIPGMQDYMVDMRHLGQIKRLIENQRPDEVYNLAAMMFTPASWSQPVDYIQVNLLAVSQILDTLFKINPEARFFQAGSADVFDRSYVPQNEETPLKPTNPYGVAKAAAQELVRVYREKYGSFACTGILFNMELPRRPDTFFTRKVAKETVRLERWFVDNPLHISPEPLVLDDLSACRDWGWTPEYVEAMWLMLHAQEPDDYVISTGHTYSCLEFVLEAFNCCQVPNYCVQYANAEIPRPDVLQGNPSKIRQKLGWVARTTMHGVVQNLIEAEYLLLDRKEEADGKGVIA